MKEIKVDENKCIGCGACVAIDAEHFDFNDNGVSCAKSQEALLQEDGSINVSVQEAIDSCPVGAIEVKEAEEKQD